LTHRLAYANIRRNPSAANAPLSKWRTGSSLTANQARPQARRPRVTLESLHSAGVSLRELLAGEIQGTCAADVRATSCTSDWRQVRPGDVFVATVDDDADGHDRAVDAAARGAAAVICERPLPVFDVPQFVVGDSRVAYGRLCQALVGNPSRQLKLIGVTGTYGKTTVARLLAAIFREAGACVGVLDSFGYWDGCDDRPRADEALTPPALALSLAQMAAAGVTHAIVELSSIDLSKQVAAGVVFDAACITQVGRKHLAWHGSVEKYREALRRVFEYLEPHGVGIINADDPASVRMLCDLNHPALTFGLRQPAEISGEVVEQHVNEQTFVLTAGDDSVGVRTAIVGDHHVENCLAAAATALAYGIDLKAIALGLEAVDRLPGRMERVSCGQDFAVVIDASNSADSLRASLRAARNTTSGRLICVFGAEDEGDDSRLRAIGRVLGAMSDIAVVTTNGLRDGVHRSCIAIRSGLADPRKARVILDRSQAIGWALSEATAGDTVLIAGMGERPHTPCDAAGMLSDIDIVKEILYGSFKLQSQHRLAA
jgi:UDP-N-acetylmuramoyl-L-alanyl-D-glutamate--2,6-diaminopimelate ligase